MFVLRLALRNRMNDLKGLVGNFGMMGPLSLALAVPWIVFRILNSIQLKRGYKELVGKVVVITGASSGLGEALAHAFYRRGALVVLCARRRHELERVRADLLRAPCREVARAPLIVPIDLSEPSDFRAAVDKIRSIAGRVDVLINNAGVSHRGHALDTALSVDRRIMAVNYFGAVALTKAVLPHMVDRKQGHVVFISSVQGLVALPDRSAYSASKHALRAFADSVRAEVAAHDVHVTVVSPGYVRTELSRNALTGEGRAHGVMDVATATGLDPAHVADRVVEAVARPRPELLLCSALPRLVIFLRNFLPCLYFYAMAKRAANQTKK